MSKKNRYRARWLLLPLVMMAWFSLQACQDISGSPNLSVQFADHVGAALWHRTGSAGAEPVLVGTIVAIEGVDYVVDVGEGDLQTKRIGSPDFLIDWEPEQSLVVTCSMTASAAKRGYCLFTWTVTFVGDPSASSARIAGPSHRLNGYPDCLSEPVLTVRP